MHSVKNKVLFVLGGPGSGKGTQCDNLVGRFKFHHLSAGDLLRKEVKSGSELGKQINTYIVNGDMVPGDVTVTLIKNAMTKCKGVFIIDGYPRNQSNIDFWHSVVKDEVEVVGCLFLKCSEETMKKRIMKRGETSGRDDDNEEVVTNRVKVYNEETLPILDHFVKQEKLFEVSAEGTIDECFSSCKEVVRKLKLDKFVKMNEMKNYLAENVDVYIKPLIVYIMKNKPTDVHEAILYWIKNEGVEIKSDLEAKRAEVIVEVVEEEEVKETPPAPVVVTEEVKEVAPPVVVTEEVKEEAPPVVVTEEVKEEAPPVVVAEEVKAPDTEVEVKETPAPVVEDKDVQGETTNNDVPK